MKSFASIVFVFFFGIILSAALPVEERALSVVAPDCSDTESFDVPEGSNDSHGCNSF
ncbi:hypothetical protein C8R46DRAFT_1229210 [Mycena filopes]|nr:hypothetical protein C8R46DRAFT_1229210 [Mycena filopes]